MDLLIAYRVYDPAGDQEEILGEGNEPGGEGEEEEGGGGDLIPGHCASPAARREDAEAMAAVAAPGGLAPRQHRDGVIPAGPLAAGNGDDAGEEEGLAAGVPGDGGGNTGEVAAPAAGGWGLAGRGEARDDVSGGDGEAGGEARRSCRYFGLVSWDEWISASSSRIEKLNSRAPWKNSWTEEVRRGERARGVAAVGGKGRGGGGLRYYAL